MHNLIDGKTFDPNHYSQIMRLNSAEEWTISNEANDKAHPFHIHVNPFQITELFQPNRGTTPRTRSKPCYVDPNEPGDVEGVRAAARTVRLVGHASPYRPSRQINVTANCQSADRRRRQCSRRRLQPYTTVRPTTTNVTTCTQTIPGYFKMRSRFVDFTGSYVLHCHILIHEDRGMMQLVEVVSDKPPYVHK